MELRQFYPEKFSSRQKFDRFSEPNHPGRSPNCRDMTAKSAGYASRISAVTGVDPESDTRISGSAALQ